MLPYFFRHYDKYVSKYFIFDNFSNDSSKKIIKSNPKAVLKRYHTRGKIRNSKLTRYKNSIWKESRRSADLVIVCDMDEFLIHPNFLDFAKTQLNSGITLFIPEGYQMVSEKFPIESKQLYECVSTGLRDVMFDKTILFSPKHIKDINFELGSHNSSPTGNVVIKSSTSLKLLHFSFLGEDDVLQKFKRNRDRLSRRNRKGNYSFHYKWSEEEIKSQFRSLLESASEVDFE